MSITSLIASSAPATDSSHGPVSGPAAAGSSASSHGPVSGPVAAGSSASSNYNAGLATAGISGPSDSNAESAGTPRTSLRSREFFTNHGDPNSWDEVRSLFGQEINPELIQSAYEKI